MRHPLCLIVAACLLLLAGCDRSSTPASNLPTVQMPVGSKTYTLEIAAKESDRNTGLMRRDSMPTDHGMIFLFASEHEQGFWMKNTRIPLDIVYLDSSGKVVSVHRMEPYKLTTVPSNGPTRYAIELNAGEAQAAGVKQGDTIPIPETIRKTPSDP